MPAPERNIINPRAAKRQRFGREFSDRKRAVAVGNLVEAFLAVVAAWRIEAAADWGDARYPQKGRGRFRVENRIRLRVAFPARGALDPNDVASGVEHHVDILGRSPNTEAREVLPTPLREAGDNGAAEISRTSWFPGDVGLTNGSEGGECFDSHGVTTETEFEEGFRRRAGSR